MAKVKDDSSNSGSSKAKVKDNLNNSGLNKAIVKNKSSLKKHTASIKKSRDSLKKHGDSLSKNKEKISKLQKAVKGLKRTWTPVKPDKSYYYVISLGENTYTYTGNEDDPGPISEHSLPTPGHGGDERHIPHSELSGKRWSDMSGGVDENGDLRLPVDRPGRDFMSDDAHSLTHNEPRVGVPPIEAHNYARTVFVHLNSSHIPSGATITGIYLKTHFYLEFDVGTGAPGITGEDGWPVTPGNCDGEPIDDRGTITMALESRRFGDREWTKIYEEYWIPISDADATLNPETGKYILNVQPVVSTILKPSTSFETMTGTMHDAGLYKKGMLRERHETRIRISYMMPIYLQECLGGASMNIEDSRFRSLMVRYNIEED